MEAPYLPAIVERLAPKHLAKRLSEAPVFATVGGLLSQ